VTKLSVGLSGPTEASRKSFPMADGARLRKELEVLRAEAHRRRVKAERLLEEVLELQHRIDAVLRHEDPPPIRRKPLKK